MWGTSKWVTKHPGETVGLNNGVMVALFTEGGNVGEEYVGVREARCEMFVPSFDFRPFHVLVRVMGRPAT